MGFAVLEHNHLKIFRFNINTAKRWLSELFLLLFTPKLFWHSILNRSNQSGLQFFRLNHWFPVFFFIFLLFVNFRFLKESDRIRVRFTIEPVESADPVRFLKPWELHKYEGPGNIPIKYTLCTSTSSNVPYQVPVST